MDTEALADKPGARTVLAELQDGPKDKVELAEALDKSPSTASGANSPSNPITGVGTQRPFGCAGKFSR